MLLENIPLGKTVEIYVDREGYRYRLVSKVEETGKRRLCVTAIMANGRAFMFHPEDDIRLVYRDSEQMWEWTKVHAGLAKLDGSPVHYFEIVNLGRSFNRRNAYRVSIDEDTEVGYYKVPDSPVRSAVVPMVKEEYEVTVDASGKEIDMYEAEYLAKEQNKKEQDNMAGIVHIEKRVRTVPMQPAIPVREKVHIKDISETGMGMLSNSEFQIDDGFFASISSTLGRLHMKANIVRCKELHNQKYKYYYGCVYTESDQKLIRYIYEIQRKQLQKQRERKEFDSYLRARKREE